MRCTHRRGRPTARALEQGMGGSMRTASGGLEAAKTDARASDCWHLGGVQPRTRARAANRVPGETNDKPVRARRLWLLSGNPCDKRTGHTRGRPALLPGFPLPISAPPLEFEGALPFFGGYLSPSSAPRSRPRQTLPAPLVRLSDRLPKGSTLQVSNAGSLGDDAHRVVISADNPLIWV